MQAGFHSLVCNGLLQLFGGAGGLNRSGGDCAKGIPRNSLTGAVAVGRVTAVPTITPASIVTVGFQADDIRNRHDANKPRWRGRRFFMVGTQKL
jgi:hypothetical protein